jgi:hypothetical protein
MVAFIQGTWLYLSGIQANEAQLAIFDSITVSEANDVHGHSSQEIGVQTDRENSNVDEPNIHDSSKTNHGNAEQTDSIVDDDVEQNNVPQNIIQGLQNKTVSKDIGMEKQMRRLMLMERLLSLIRARNYLYKVVLK